MNWLELFAQIVAGFVGLAAVAVAGAAVWAVLWILEKVK